MLNGTINLKAFKGSTIETINGKEGTFIPHEDNHLQIARNGGVYIKLLAFATNKLLPFSHNIILSVPEKFRNGKWLLGGWKLE